MRGLGFGLGIEIARKGGAPAVPTAPTDISLSATSIAEDASVGSVVAFISANGYPAATFTELADPDGKFTVSGNELRLAAGLDYETTTSHSVTIQSANGVGSPYSEVFTINVTDVDEGEAPIAPTLERISADGVFPATFRLTPVSPLSGDKFPVRISALPDFSDVDADSETLDPGGIVPDYMDFTPELPDGTWYLNGGVLRGATLVWSAAVLTNTVTTAPAGHRHWRINVTNTVLETAMEWMEVELLVGGVDQTGSGTASASSYFNIFFPYQAFDDDTGTRWASDFSGTWPQWLAYDFGSGVSKDIDEVTIAVANQDRSPASFDVQYSDDGSTWTTLWSESGLVVSDWTAGTPKSFARP